MKGDVANYCIPVGASADVRRAHTHPLSGGVVSVSGCLVLRPWTQLLVVRVVLVEFQYWRTATQYCCTSAAALASLQAQNSPYARSRASTVTAQGI